jgi:hypothetical protein
MRKAEFAPGIIHGAQKAGDLLAEHSRAGTGDELSRNSIWWRRRELNPMSFCSCVHFTA